MFRFFVSQHVWHIQIAKEVLLYLKRPWYRWLVIHAYNPSDFHFSPDTKCDLEEKDFFFFIPFLHEPTMREQVNVIGCQTTHTDFFLLLRRRVIILRLQFKSDLLHFFFSILKNFVFNGRASAVFAAFTEGGGEVRYVSLLATFIYMNIRVQLSGRSFDQQQPKSINPRICPVLSFPLPIYERRCCCPCRPHTQAKLVFFFFCRACIVVNFEWVSSATTLFVRFIFFLSSFQFWFHSPKWHVFDRTRIVERKRLHLNGCVITAVGKPNQPLICPVKKEWTNRTLFFFPLSNNKWKTCFYHGKMMDKNVDNHEGQNDLERKKNKIDRKDAAVCATTFMHHGF